MSRGSLCCFLSPKPLLFFVRLPHPPSLAATGLRSPPPAPSLVSHTHAERAARARAARTAYVHLGRQRQALFLRLAGLRNRRSQRPAIRLLRKAGADLMGFTTALRIQKKDLRQGARLAWQEIDMYREAFRSVAFDCALPHFPPPARVL